MLTVRRIKKYAQPNMIELMWDAQSDPSDSEYSSWTPDQSRQGSITFPAHMVGDVTKALNTVIDLGSIEEIRLGE